MAPVPTPPTLLPSYCWSEPPEYSSSPACGERILQLTPRNGRPIPTGTFLKTSGNITVSLFDQEEGASQPSYGQRSLISGMVNIKNPGKVASVTVKVEGKIDEVTSEAGSRVTTFLVRSSQLWKKRSCEDICPDFLPFSSTLPPMFSHGGSERLLPPTYKASHPGIPALFVNVKYLIVVHVAYSRHSFDLLGKNQVIEIPFSYVPRTRANRPIVPAPCIFSAVKVSPDEWYQTHTLVKPRSDLDVDPVQALMFIPAARVYGLRDKIPFHLQLNGPVCSLRKFVLPDTEIQHPTAGSPKAAKMPKKHPLQARPIFTVKLMRRVTVEAKGQTLWRNSTTGVGEIWEVPPDLYPPEPAVEPAVEPGKCAKAHLDWKGKVQAFDYIKTGGFNAMNVSVKDNIVLSIQPPAVQNELAPFLTVQVTIPIRFVTDSYVDVTDYDVGNLGT